MVEMEMNENDVKDGNAIKFVAPNMIVTNELDSMNESGKMNISAAFE